MGDVRKRFSTGDVDRVRITLLKRIYEEDEDDELHIKRQAIRQLMGPIIAARKSGMTFELISEIFQGDGLEITPATLRSYYFDFKAETEANKLTARQVEQIQETRDRFSTEKVVKKGDQAHRAAAKEANRKLAGKMKIIPAAELLAGDPGEKGPSERQPRSVPAQRQPSTPRPEKSTPSPSTSHTRERPPSTNSCAPTLEELRKHADSAEGKEELSEDVVLRTDNRVYYASGEPFDGILTTRQLRLLGISRRLVAQKKGAGGDRTKGSFTKLPDKL